MGWADSGRLVVPGVLAGSLLALQPALAEDEAPLLEDPVGVLSPAPTPVGGATLTAAGAWQRARSGPNRDLWLGGFEAEAGLAEGLDLRFTQLMGYGSAAPYPADDAARVWGGASRLGLRWQFREQQGVVPALGVFAAVSTAYGETSRPSTAAEVTLLAASTIVEGPRPVALYLNAGVLALTDPQPGERPDYYQFAAGVAHTLAQDTSVALSYGRNQQARGLRDENIVTAGIWHRPQGWPILGASVGFGIGADSPSFFVGLSAKLVFGGE